MVTMPASSNSSLRSLARTSAVSTPRRVEQVQRALHQGAAGHRDHQAVGGAHPNRSSAARAMCTRCTSRPTPQAGSERPKRPDQLVVAPAAAQREAHGRVVDLVHRARVVAEVAHQAQVQDHAVGHAPVGQRLVAAWPAPPPSAAAASAARSSTSGPPRSSGRRVSGRRAASDRPSRSTRISSPTRSRARQRARAGAAVRSGTSSERSMSRYSAPSPRPMPVAGQPRSVQRGQQERDHLGLALGARHADQLGARLEELALLAACPGRPCGRRGRSSTAAAAGLGAGSGWRPPGRWGSSCPSAAPARGPGRRTCGSRRPRPGRRRARSTSSYSIAGVHTSPYPAASNVARSASEMARTSRISSGSTSRVPGGIGWIMRVPPPL